MEFMLPFDIPSPEMKGGYRDKIFFTGSCFSTEISQRMEHLKFQVFSNPSGIIYHPLNIAEGLKRVVGGVAYTEEDLVTQAGLSHSWQHHSRFSGSDRDEVLRTINDRLSEAASFLKQSRFLILSPATAFAYYLKEDNRLVANCHKIPASSFTKRMSTVEEIVKELGDALEEVKKFNRNVRFIFTVSPVKHLRDGVVANNLSKAVVLQAVHRLVEQFAGSWYFPSFEILNDELRDYRFYKPDFAHPTEAAVDYILKKFLDVFLDDESKDILKRVRPVLTASAHRPRTAASDEYLKFCNSQLQTIVNLEKEFPFLNFEREKQIFSGD